MKDAAQDAAQDVAQDVTGAEDGSVGVLFSPSSLPAAEPIPNTRRPPLTLPFKKQLLLSFPLFRITLWAGGGRCTCGGWPPPEDFAASAAPGTLELLGARNVRVATCRK